MGTTMRRKLFRDATRGIKGSKTKEDYGRWIDRFLAYQKEIGVPIERTEDITKDMIQSYIKAMTDKGLSAWTIRSYISPLTNAISIKQKELDLPKRKSSDIKKGRNTKNKSIPVEKTRMERMGKAIDIRRDELAHLKKEDLVEDEAGRECVRVKKGKCGKRQLQIIQSDKEWVIEQFRNAESWIFSKNEIKGSENLHRYRREVAWTGYQQVLPRAENNELEIMWNEINERVKLLAKDEKHRKKIVKSMIEEIWKKDKETGQMKLKKDLALRDKDLRELARQTGKPISYNRMVLLYVSVFHLSHWRGNVALYHYILT